MAQGGTAPSAAMAPRMNMLGDGETKELRIYNDGEAVAEEINKAWKEAHTSGNERSFLAALSMAGISTASTVMSNIVQKSITGIQSAINRKDTQHEEWLKEKAASNIYADTLRNISQMKDFYDKVSLIGALDPQGMRFSGIGFEQKFGDRTVVSMKCSIDDSEEGISEIVNHGKFRLILDELVVNPYLCNLPSGEMRRAPGMQRAQGGPQAGTPAMAEGPREMGQPGERPQAGEHPVMMDGQTPRQNAQAQEIQWGRDTVGSGFNFDKRKDLKYSFSIKIRSSWMNQAIQLCTDQVLGEFTFESPIITKDMVDSITGEYRYSREEVLARGEAARVITITGTSFLVPRSYIGTVDNGGIPQDVWSTGEYDVQLALKESCQLTSVYKNWMWEDEYAATHQKGKKQSAGKSKQHNITAKQAKKMREENLAAGRDEFYGFPEEGPVRMENTFMKTVTQYVGDGKTIITRFSTSLISSSMNSMNSMGGGMMMGGMQGDAMGGDMSGGQMMQGGSPGGMPGM